jgi:hypothetical protein
MSQHSQSPSTVLSRRESPVLSRRASPVLSRRASPVLSRRASPVLSRRASPVNLQISDEVLKKIKLLEQEALQASQASQKSFTSNIIQNEIDKHEIEYAQRHNVNQDEYKTKEQQNSYSKCAVMSPLSPKIKQQIEYAKKEDKKNIQNGWDVSALTTLNNWYQSFKEQSYCYQYILDKNRKISTRLSLISIASSSILSIFAGFKLWNSSDESYQSGSDVAMMISNFIVAAITTASKRYIDDQRNEQIRSHIENIDAFLGKIYAQVYIDAKYRTNAEDFIKDNVEEYTNLMITCPNLSIQELTEAKKNYRKFNEIEQNINKKELARKEKEIKEKQLKHIKEIKESEEFKEFKEFKKLQGGYNNKYYKDINKDLNKNDTDIDIDINTDNNIDYINYKDNDNIGQETEL